MPADAYLSAIVTILAMLLFTWMGIRVGRMRGKHGIKAPAMTGHPEFERAVRVHMNTLEGLAVFLPALWLTTIYLDARIAAALGAIWIVGRVVYMQGYMREADKRGLGFGIAGIVNIVLILTSIAGVAMTAI